MSDDLFEIGDRKIYRYQDGSGNTRFADPLIIRTTLLSLAMQHGKTVNGLIDEGKAVDLKNATPEQLVEGWNALKLLASITMDAFELKPMDPATGDGATMAQAIALINHYHRFCEKKNRKPASPATSMPPTESTSGTPTTTVMS